MTVAMLLLSAAVAAMGEGSPGLLPTPVPAADAVVVMDLLKASDDERLVATTLQGLVNRQPSAELYLLLAEWDAFWLDYMRSERWNKEQVRLSLQEGLERYASRIKTIVVYDPALPASINIASMTAAVEDGIAVAPETPLGAWAASIPAADLRGRWSSNAEAYGWALESLLPRMNPGVLACYHPAACRHHLRDYLTQHKVFHFWATAAGPQADFAEERAVVEKILAATAPTIPVLGFWYSGVDPGIDEYVGVGMAGEYGKITVVSDWATNLSFLGGVSVDLNGAIERYAKRVVAAPPALDPEKVYLCVDIVESGDSPSYVQSRMHQVWRDAKRGAAPINWSLGPAILDLAPPVAHYYYQHAAPLDCLYMAISGAGYCHPYRDLFVKTPEPERAWSTYLDHTRRQATRMGAQAVGLYTDAWKPYDRGKHDAVTRRFAEALPAVEQFILGMGRDDSVAPDDANYRLDAGADAPLITHVMTRWPVDYGAKTREENIDWLVEDIRAHAPKTRPGFMHVMALSWVFGPSEIAAVLEGLGDEYAPVTLPQYLALYKAAARDGSEQ